MIPEMKLDYLSWEAVATILTGVSAVMGAVIIGLRQVAVAQRQIDLIENQVEIQRMTLRLALFDKRFSYRQLFRRYYQSVNSSDDIDTELEKEFLETSFEAEFLFPKALSVLVDGIYLNGMELRDVKKDIDAASSVRERDERRFRFKELRIALRDQLKEFDELVGPFLRIDL